MSESIPVHHLVPVQLDQCVIALTNAQYRLAVRDFTFFTRAGQGYWLQIGQPLTLYYGSRQVHGTLGYTNIRLRAGRVYIKCDI